MRHSPVALIMLFASAAVVAAQTPGQTRVTPAIQVQAFAFDTGTPGLASRATPDDVVTHLMSFDRDQDGKVSPSELPERMQPLIVRGDADFDGSLDAKEVRTIALAPTAPVTARGFHSGGYGFADEVGFSSSRSHIDGTLDDLGLPQQTRREAGAIASAFLDALEADAAANVMKDLEHVLSPAQLLEFRNALDHPDQNRKFVMTRQTGNVVQRLVIQSALEAQIEKFGLEQDDKRAAMAAVDQYKARLRLSDADRSALLEPMKDLLSAEQREDLQAALARRPLVKNGVMGGVVGGAVFTGKVPMIDVAQPVPAILVR